MVWIGITRALSGAGHTSRCDIPWNTIMAQGKCWLELIQSCFYGRKALICLRFEDAMTVCTESVPFESWRNKQWGLLINLDFRNLLGLMSQFHIWEYSALSYHSGQACCWLFLADDLLFQYFLNPSRVLQCMRRTFCIHSRSCSVLSSLFHVDSPQVSHSTEPTGGWRTGSKKT